jgi:type VI secretion system protein ImpM
VLPPGSLPFASKEYVIGVWIASSDKVGRSYPLVMMQVASLKWVEQHFSYHPIKPCDWLFSAARAMAKAVYADAEQAMQPNHPAAPVDHLMLLTAQLDDLWATVKPDWRELFGRSSASFDFFNAQKIIGSPHPEDPAHYLDGVRYLPWSDWPKKLTIPRTNKVLESAFWQSLKAWRFLVAESL